MITDKSSNLIHSSSSKPLQIYQQQRIHSARDYVSHKKDANLETSSLGHKNAISRISSLDAHQIENQLGDDIQSVMS